MKTLARFAGIFALGLVVSATTFAQGQWGNDNRVFFAGRRLEFKEGERPYWSQGTLMVPFRALAAKIGAQVGRSRSGERVWIEDRGNHVEFTQGRVDFWMNGRRVPLTMTSEDKTGLLFVPIRLFADVSNHRVSYDRGGDRRGD